MLGVLPFSQKVIKRQPMLARSKPKIRTKTHLLINTPPSPIPIMYFVSKSNPKLISNSRICQKKNPALPKFLVFYHERTKIKSKN